MTRLAPVALALLVPLAALTSAPLGARAAAPRKDLVWEPIGPVATASGFTSVATDPEDSRVVWVGGTTSVWVSEDAGQTWNLVLHLARSSGLARETGDGDTIEVDPDPPDQTPEGEDVDDVEDLSFEDEILVDPRTGREMRTSRDDPDEADDAVEETEGGDDAGDRGPRFGVTRLRVLADRVWVCTSRGLWSIARSARRTGTGVELRFGRRMAVNDVARGPDKRLYLATERGLWVLGDDGIARIVQSIEEAAEARGLVLVGDRLVVATSLGLRVGDGDRFERVALGGKDEAGLDDVVLEADGRVAIAGGNNVYRLAQGASVVDEVWSVPGASRLANGRDGLWAVGDRGAWRFTQADGWTRLVEGLFDRRLVDVAPSDAGDVYLWVAGRAGLWRLVPESARVYSSQLKALSQRALEGYPSSEETIRWASAARGTTLDKVDGWVMEERLSWLLPQVEVSFRMNRTRFEDYTFIPTIDRRILDSVRVEPIDDRWRIMAWWDVMPAMLAAIDGAAPAFESARSRARRQQERVREVVLPIWQAWAKKRIDYVTSEPETTRAALRDLIAIERLEADLHVYTGGRFPAMSEGRAKAPKATP